MKPTLILISLAALFVGGLRDQFCTSNVEGAAGTHEGALSRRADAASGQTHLLYKQGTDALHVALCGQGDYPVGISSDQAEAAEDIINVCPLGSCTEGTRKFRSAGALSANVDIFTAASGLVQTLPGSGGGTCYKVGRTVAAAVQVGSSSVESPGYYIVEAAPCQPVATTIAT